MRWRQTEEILLIITIGEEEKRNIISRFEKLKEKHKLSFTNDTTYHEKWSFKLSSLNLISLLFLYSVVLIFFLVLLVKFTPLKSLFIDNANFFELNEIIIINEIKEIIFQNNCNKDHFPPKSLKS